MNTTQTTDPTLDAADCLDWVVEPPDEISFAITAAFDARMILDEELD